MNLEKIIKEVLNEVRYLDPKPYNTPKDYPLKDTENIRVYHGFGGNSRNEIFKVLKYGLSGKENANRVYSYETVNNPKGLFVSTNIDVVKKNFSNSGFIIEFTTKVSDLESPIWAGGRGYFTQGETTSGFKPDTDEREQQRLINREKASKSKSDTISKSDRPELGDMLFSNSENQALFIGDLNPNMIKAIWYNEKLHKENKSGDKWVRMSRKDFINKLKIDTNRKSDIVKFYPNDDFTIEKFRSFIDSDEELKSYIEQIIKYDLNNNYTLKQYGFWPKQIKQIRDLHLKGYFDKYLNENINEVRYLDTKGYNIPKEKPVMDTETIRVYHGFYSEKDVFEVVTRGLSGKESARRVYSYESGNNPYGLFVTTDFNIANKFASSGVIIEFTAKVSDLEAPIWSGGGGYFVQGQMTTSFNPDTDEREQQKLINRDIASKSEYEAISKSDRPELGETLFDNPERQALYTGDLNPNMIKRVWYNEIRDKKNRTDGSWIKYSVKDFIKLKNITKNTNTIKFLPNDDFTIEKFKSFLRVNDEKQLKAYIKQIFYNLDDYRLKQYGFWPKQIKQIKDLHSKGYFDKYLNESIILEEYSNVINEIKKQLGYGQSGKAIQKNDRVFKITKSSNEYDIASKINKSNKDFESLIKIYGTRKLNNNEYLIIREYVNEIPDDFAEQIGEDLYEIIDFFTEKTLDITKSNSNLTELFEPKFLKFLEKLKKEIISIGYKPHYFDIEGIPNNIGIDNKGNYKLFDF